MFKTPIGPRAVASAAALMIATVASCGYSVMRSDRFFERSQIAVLPFLEDQPVGLSAPLSDALARRLAAGGVEISNDAGAAQAILKGEIIAQSTRANASWGAVVAYGVSVTVLAVLEDHNGTVLWQKRIQDRDDFLNPTTSDHRALTAEASRREALQRLAEQLARALHEDLIMVSSL